MPTISYSADKVIKLAQAFDTFKDAWAIVPASGTSQRMRASLAESSNLSDLSENLQSKIFLELAPRICVLHSSLKRLHDSGLRNICIATQRELFDEVSKIAREVVGEGGAWDNLLVVDGGGSRFQSVRNAMFEIEKFSPRVVAIHDAARPFPSSELIFDALSFVMEGIAKDENFDIGAILACPLSSTIKLLKDDLFILETPPRDKLCEAQTPQIFPYNTLLEAYKNFPIDSNFSDDASIFEKIGKNVKVFKSSPENIKVTTKEDYFLAKLLIKHF